MKRAEKSWFEDLAGVLEKGGYVFLKKTQKWRSPISFLPLPLNEAVREHLDRQDGKFAKRKCIQCGKFFNIMPHWDFAKCSGCSQDNYRKNGSRIKSLTTVVDYALYESVHSLLREKGGTISDLLRAALIALLNDIKKEGESSEAS
jgi:hypothetical protein